MERELATRDFETIMADLKRLEAKHEAASRKRTRECIALVALPFIFIIAAGAYLETKFERQDRINQETASHD